LTLFVNYMYSYTATTYTLVYTKLNHPKQKKSSLENVVLEEISVSVSLQGIMGHLVSVSDVTPMDCFLNL